MRIVFLVGGVIAAIAMLVIFVGVGWTGAETETYFYRFAIWAHDGFWGKFFGLGIVLGIVVVIHMMCIRITSQNRLLTISKTDFDPSSRSLFWAIAALLALLFFGAWAGYHMGYNHEPNWRFQDNFDDFVFGFFSIIMIIPYIGLYVVTPPLVGFAVVASLYTWLCALIYLTTRHPAAGLVERSAARKRPDRVVEGALASLLKNYHASDRNEASRLVKELSPFRRWKWSIRAKKHADEAKRLGNIARTRSDSLKADTSLMHDVHGMERAKRNRN